MSSRVLIIGPRFFYFNASIERAFASLGYDTRVEAYDNPIHPYDRWNMIRYKLAADKRALHEESRKRYSPYILRVFDDYRPQIVFIINGDNLAPDVVQTMREKARVGIWLFDSLTRMPDCAVNLPHAHRVFCYEQEDIAAIRSKWGIEAEFLPQAVDTRLYHPLPSAVDKQYDLVFAGDIFHSRKRRAIVTEVVARYPDLRIKVWGIYKPWFKNPLKWLLRERKDVYMNCNATAEQLNDDYNRARVVLNVHHEQQRNGANPKVYEIAASGAYQLCDSNPYIDRLFGEGGIGLYHSVDELCALLEEALRQPQEELNARAQSALHSVVSSHTFVNRIRQVIDSL